jgi:hypothetical protein
VYFVALWFVLVVLLCVGRALQEKVLKVYRSCPQLQKGRFNGMGDVRWALMLLCKKDRVTRQERKFGVSRRIVLALYVVPEQGK